MLSELDDAFTKVRVVVTKAAESVAPIINSGTIRDAENRWVLFPISHQLYYKLYKTEVELFLPAENYKLEFDGLDDSARSEMLYLSIYMKIMNEKVNWQNVSSLSQLALFNELPEARNFLSFLIMKMTIKMEFIDILIRELLKDRRNSALIYANIEHELLSRQEIIYLSQLHRLCDDYQLQHPARLALNSSMVLISCAGVYELLYQFNNSELNRMLDNLLSSDGNFWKYVECTFITIKHQFSSADYSCFPDFLNVISKSAVKFIPLSSKSREIMALGFDEAFDIVHAFWSSEMHSNSSRNYRTKVAAALNTVLNEENLERSFPQNHQNQQQYMKEHIIIASSQVDF